VVTTSITTLVLCSGTVKQRSVELQGDHTLSWRKPLDKVRTVFKQSTWPLQVAGCGKRFVGARPNAPSDSVQGDTTFARGRSIFVSRIHRTLGMELNGDSGTGKTRRPYWCCRRLHRSFGPQKARASGWHCRRWQSYSVPSLCEMQRGTCQEVPRGGCTRTDAVDVNCWRL